MPFRMILIFGIGLPVMWDVYTVISKYIDYLNRILLTLGACFSKPENWGKYVICEISSPKLWKKFPYPSWFLEKSRLPSIKARPAPSAISRISSTRSGANTCVLEVNGSPRSTVFYKVSPAMHWEISQNSHCLAWLYRLFLTKGFLLYYLSCGKSSS